MNLARRDVDSRERTTTGATAEEASFRRALETAQTNRGDSLLRLSERQPLLLVFFRHLGCPFCREALSQLKARRREIEAAGTLPVLVHMGRDDQAHELFGRFDLGDVPRVSDPQVQLYRAFGLERGRLSQVIGPGVWWRGATALLKGHLPGAFIGDTLQMPGVFLLFRGEILRAFRHEHTSDLPDYVELSCPVQGR